MRRRRVSARNDWNKQMIAEYRARKGKGIPNFGDNLLLLNTVGSKSGQPRVNPVAFTKDGDKYVIVASKGGAPSNPDWYYNLIAKGTATIDVGGETVPVRATEVKGTRRDQLYAKHAERFPGFIEYEQKTTRKIPVLTLERVGS
jgi:deazaflavin-dependent oxidoreductase (nitroreductase family)